MKIYKKISLPFSHLLNDSMSTETFANTCKLAQTIHIFKNDSKLLCTSCRSVSLLSNASKSFEKAIHSRLHFFLEQHNPLYPYPFGFRVNYSANNALMTIAERIQMYIDAGYYTAGVFVDLKTPLIQWITTFYFKNLITVVLEAL